MECTLGCSICKSSQAVDDITGQYGSADSYFISNVAVNYKFSKEATLQLGIQNCI